MLYGIHSIQRDDDIAVVYVKHPPEIPGVAYMTFGSLADGNVDVDIILQTASVGHGNDLIFTVHAQDMERAREILTEQFRAHPETVVEIDPTAVKLSVSGEGMQGKPCGSSISPPARSRSVCSSRSGTRTGRIRRCSTASRSSDLLRPAASVRLFRREQGAVRQSGPGQKRTQPPSVSRLREADVFSSPPAL